jgi:hypothetical protein
VTVGVDGSSVGVGDKKVDVVVFGDVDDGVDVWGEAVRGGMPVVRPSDVMVGRYSGRAVGVDRVAVVDGVRVGVMGRAKVGSGEERSVVVLVVVVIVVTVVRRCGAV